MSTVIKEGRLIRDSRQNPILKENYMKEDFSCKPNFLI